MKRMILALLVLLAMVGGAGATIISSDNMTRADSEDMNANTGLTKWYEDVGSGGFHIVGNRAIPYTWGDISDNDVPITSSDYTIQFTIASLDISQNTNLYVCFYTQSLYSDCSGTDNKYILAFNPSTGNIIYGIYINTGYIPLETWSGTTILNDTIVLIDTSTTTTGLNVSLDGTLNTFISNSSYSNGSVGFASNWVYHGFKNYYVNSTTIPATNDLDTCAVTGQSHHETTYYDAVNGKWYNDTIFVNGTNNTLCHIYKDINDETEISFTSPNIYTLESNITVNPDMILNITNQTLIFNNSYRLWTKGALYIDNSTITSRVKVPGTYSERGYIEGRKIDSGATGYILQIRNSTLSYLGGDGVDEYGEAKRGIFAYPPQTGDGLTRAPIIVEYNNISNMGIQVGQHSYDDYVRNNNFTDIHANETAVTLYQGFIENNTITNMSSTYGLYILGGNSTIRNNLIQNSHATASGMLITTKEGDGGRTIENNIIRDSSAGIGAIATGGSQQTLWTIIRNNTIYNFTGGALWYTVGNCYLNGTEVSEEFRDNLAYNTSTNFGIQISYTPYFNDRNQYPCGSGTDFDGAKHILVKNNTVYDSSIAAWIEGTNFLNTTFINNNFYNNTIDIKTSNGDSSRPLAKNLTHAFINNNYSILSMNSGKYLEYVFADLNITTTAGAVISGATITITNLNDSYYAPLNASNSSNNWTMFTSGSDGHTDLPNESAPIILMDFWKGNATYGLQNMTYNISVSAPGYTTNSSVVISPDSSWYRSNPNTYQNTTTIILSDIPPLTCGYNTNSNITIFANGSATTCSPTNSTALSNMSMSFLQNTSNDWYQFNLTSDTASLMQFNESSNNATLGIRITFINKTANSNYSARTFWNNGTKFLDTYIISNATGGFAYNTTEFSYSRYTVITNEVPSNPYVVIIYFVTVIIGGIAYYLRRIKKI